MFQFNPTWDIGHDDFKEIVLSVQSIKMDKFSAGTEWPLFKQWFIKKLANFVDTDKFNLNDFKDAIEVNRVPRRFAVIVESLIKAAYSESFLKSYDDENGIEMFCKLNGRYMILTSYEKIKLLRSIIHPSVIEKDNKSLKKTITLICSHFPSFKPIAPYMALLKVENQDVARYLRTNSLAGNSVEVTMKMESLTINDIFRDINELREEGILNMIESEPAITEYDEANIIMSKVRCYNCGKLGHFSNKCRKPKKAGSYEKVQLVECPDDFEVSFDKSQTSDEVHFIDDKQLKFVLDSGATTHVVHDKSLLSDVEDTEIIIKGVNGDDMCKHKGSVNVGNLHLVNVKHMPKAPRNIISLPQLCNCGFHVDIKGDSLKITKNGKLIANSIKDGKLWYLEPSNVLEEMVFDTTEDIDAIHKSNGHCSLNQMKTLTNGSYSESQLKDVLNNCDTCKLVVNKTNIRKSDHQETIVGEYLVADIIGPINGAYGLIVSDKKSSFIVAQVLKVKSEATDKLIETILIFEKLLNLTNKSLCFIRTDNEFLTKKFAEFCQSKGIIHQLTAPHSSFQNGKAENINGQIERKMKKLLIDSNVPNKYWNFAFRHSVFLHNYLPLNNSNQSPWEVFRQTKKHVEVSAPFGCKIVAFNHNVKQKIFKRDTVGTFLGFQATTKIAYILEKNTDKIIRLSSFNFIQSVLPYQPSSSTSTEIPITASSGTSSSNDSSISTSTQPTEQSNSTITQTEENDIIPSTLNEITTTTNEEIEVESKQKDTTMVDPNDPVTVNSVKITKPINKNKILRLKKKRNYLTIKRLKSLSNQPDNLNMLTAPIKPIVQEIDDDNDQPNEEIKAPLLIENQPIQDLTASEESHLLVSKSKYNIPINYNQVLSSPQKDKWIAAINDEMKSIQQNQVYDLVSRSSVNEKPVNSRWVFAVKHEADGSERFKARLVAKGFLQQIGENYIDVYAPVMKFETLRLMLAIASMKGFNLCQLDAKTAFLNGDIDYKVYLNPPAGSGTPSEFIWKLKKGLYGLKQAPHIWFNTIKDALLQSGKFKQSVMDPCFFYNNNCYISIYVDDILIASENSTYEKEATNILMNKFTMKNMGEPKLFLGCNISKHSHGYLLNLSEFTKKIENDFNIIKQKQLMTPLAKGFDDANNNTKQLSPDDHSKYRSIVGTLLFMANTVRYDIAFATSLLSRFLVSPTKHHLAGAYRVLQFVCQTKDFEISFNNNKHLPKFTDFRLLDKTDNATIQDYPSKLQYQITSFSDSDFASDKSTRKSQNGFFTLLNGNIISWASKKQSLVALSTTEAEYIGFTEAIKSAVYLKNMLNEINFQNSFVDLLGDNMSSLTLASHPYTHNKSKHIDIKYHFIREKVNSKQIKLNYVNTKLNIADMLTKCLDTTTHTNLIKLINQ